MRTQPILASASLLFLALGMTGCYTRTVSGGDYWGYTGHTPPPERVTTVTRVTEPAPMASQEAVVIDTVKHLHKGASPNLPDTMFVDEVARTRNDVGYDQSNPGNQEASTIVNNYYGPSGYDYYHSWRDSYYQRPGFSVSIGFGYPIYSTCSPFYGYDPFYGPSFGCYAPTYWAYDPYWYSPYVYYPSPYYAYNPYYGYGGYGYGGYDNDDYGYGNGYYGGTQNNNSGPRVGRIGAGNTRAGYAGTTGRAPNVVTPNVAVNSTTTNTRSIASNMTPNVIVTSQAPVSSVNQRAPVVGSTSVSAQPDTRRLGPVTSSTVGTTPTVVAGNASYNNTRSAASTNGNSSPSVYAPRNGGTDQAAQRVYVSPAVTGRTAPQVSAAPQNANVARPQVVIVRRSYNSAQNYSRSGYNNAGNTGRVYGGNGRTTRVENNNGSVNRGSRSPSYSTPRNSTPSYSAPAESAPRSSGNSGSSSSGRSSGGGNSGGESSSGGSHSSGGRAR